MQRPPLAILLASVLITIAASAQDNPRPRFDVASVKYAGAGEPDGTSDLSGGPGTSDPETIAYTRQPLVRLLHAAYGIEFDQISGPAWLGSEFYSVVARVPPGTTKDQARLMWQDLLSERFHLTFHWIQKDYPAYALSVDKGGPKLRRSGQTAGTQEPGFPVLALGATFGRLSIPPRNVRATFRDSSMADLAERIGWPLGVLGASGGFTIGRVVDRTGLDGRYDFQLEFAGWWGPGGAFPRPLPDGEAETASTLVDALQQQLGLRLEEKKAPLNVLVVDHVDKLPTDN